MRTVVAHASPQAPNRAALAIGATIASIALLCAPAMADDMDVSGSLSNTMHALFTSNACTAMQHYNASLSNTLLQNMSPFERRQALKEKRLELLRET